MSEELTDTDGAVERLGQLCNPVELLYPWDRTPNERAEEYVLLTKYLGMGPSRDISELSVLTGHTTVHLRALATRRNWETRTLAYDANLKKMLSEYHRKYVDGMLSRNMTVLTESLQYEISRVLSQQLTEMESGEEVTVATRTTRMRRLSATLLEIARFQKEINAGETDDARPTSIIFESTSKEDAQEQALENLAKAMPTPTKEDIAEAELLPEGE